MICVFYFKGKFLKRNIPYQLKNNLTFNLSYVKTSIVTKILRLNCIISSLDNPDSRSNVTSISFFILIKPSGFEIKGPTLGSSKKSVSLHKHKQFRFYDKI